jgi:putative phosphoesterase
VLVVVFSDTHLPRGSRRLPAACLDLVANADLALHAGDFTSVAAFDELSGLAPLRAVSGNMDEPALQALLPERLVVEAGAARLGMVHDAGPPEGRPERLVAAFPGCAAVVYGHTHQPEVSEHEGVWILNPGSPTERRRAPHRSLLTLGIDGDRLRPQLVLLP